jgi:hypothetical protein
LRDANSERTRGVLEGYDIPEEIMQEYEVSLNPKTLNFLIFRVLKRNTDSMLMFPD